MASPCASAMPVVPTDCVACCCMMAPTPKKTSPNVPISSARKFRAPWIIAPPPVPPSRALPPSPLQRFDGLLVQTLRQLHEQLHGRVVVLAIHDRGVTVDVARWNEDDE